MTLDPAPVSGQGAGLFGCTTVLQILIVQLSHRNPLLAVLFLQHWVFPNRLRSGPLD